MTLLIDKASGRAKCGLCHQLIKAGESEVIANLGSGQFPTHYHRYTTNYIKNNIPTVCVGFVVKYAEVLKELAEDFDV